MVVLGVFTVFKRTIFESKSQQFEMTKQIPLQYLQYSKEQYLKANHNWWLYRSVNGKSIYSIQKNNI